MGHMRHESGQVKSKIGFCLWPLLMVASCWSAAAGEVTKVGDSLVDPGALTIKGGINGLSFQQEAVISHKKYQYVAYYDAQRRVCLGRRKLPAGRWEIIRFADYDFKSNDPHNTISMGICPNDGTIHLAFDHHGHPLHYRVSRKHAASHPDRAVWTTSLFGPVVSELENGKPIALTYPRFWSTPDGGLQFCYRKGRAGRGDRFLVDYQANAETWTGTRQIDSGTGSFTDGWGKSESRCSYPNGYDFGPNGKLHVTWVWREGTGNANHDLMYAYSEDLGKTWLNNKGKPIPTPHVNSPDIKVATILRGWGLINTSGQAVDSQGRVHVVMWHCTDESLQAAGSGPLTGYNFGPPTARRYHHYWRAHDGTWSHRELPWIAGNRPKVFMDRNDNAWLIWGAKQQTAMWYGLGSFSKADLMIAAATATSGWTDWQTVHVERGPFANEMLGDKSRWKYDGVLSVIVQESAESQAPAALRILDFHVGQ